MIEVIGPIHVLIGLGYLARRFGLLPDDAVRSLSLITFGVVTPALLFRSMAQIGPAGLSPGATTSYFTAALLVYGGVVFWVARREASARPLAAAPGSLDPLDWPAEHAAQRAASPFRLGRAAVIGLGATFSNTIMLGIPLIRLSHGQAGVGVLISIIALHALIMMTVGTFTVELSRRQQSDGSSQLLSTIRNALMHPVTFPILLGLAWAWLAGLLGWRLPGILDNALRLLGEANAPLSLLLLGASLQPRTLGAIWPRLIGVALIKLVVFPALVYVLGRWLFGLSPLALTVSTLTAGIATGANVFLFAQRYQEEVAWSSALVTMSTLLCALSLPLWLLWLQ